MNCKHTGLKKAPWIPAPAKTTKSSKPVKVKKQLSWEDFYKENIPTKSDEKPSVKTTIYTPVYISSENVKCGNTHRSAKSERPKSQRHLRKYDCCHLSMFDVKGHHEGLSSEIRILHTDRRSTARSEIDRFALMDLRGTAREQTSQKPLLLQANKHQRHTNSKDINPKDEAMNRVLDFFNKKEKSSEKNIRLSKLQKEANDFNRDLLERLHKLELKVSTNAQNSCDQLHTIVNSERSSKILPNLNDDDKSPSLNSPISTGFITPEPADDLNQRIDESVTVSDHLQLVHVNKRVSEVTHI